jgi:hypothetical protein
MYDTNSKPENDSNPESTEDFTESPELNSDPVSVESPGYGLDSPEPENSFNFESTDGRLQFGLGLKISRDSGVNMDEVANSLSRCNFYRNLALRRLRGK